MPSLSIFSCRASVRGYKLWNRSITSRSSSSITTTTTIRSGSSTLQWNNHHANNIRNPSGIVFVGQQQQQLRQQFFSTTATATTTTTALPFTTEGHYHRVADESLEEIQDAIEDILEDTADAEDEYEVTLSSGVLTVGIPPHGTYVLNKQTPNQQVWLSSPISGPRRYDYDVHLSTWVYTRDESITLKQTLMEEFQTLLQVDLKL